MQIQIAIAIDEKFLELFPTDYGAMANAVTLLANRFGSSVQLRNLMPSAGFILATCDDEVLDDLDAWLRKGAIGIAVPAKRVLKAAADKNK